MPGRVGTDPRNVAACTPTRRTAWAICAENGWWSVFGKKKVRGKGGKVGPPVHDDLVGRVFSADGPNQLWLTDLTEHPTSEARARQQNCPTPPAIRHRDRE